MTHPPIEFDERPTPREPSDLYRSLVLKIDADIAGGGGSEIHFESLTGLSSKEAARLNEARECLQRLYRSANAERSGDRASTTTIFLPAAVSRSAFGEGRAVDYHGDEFTEGHGVKIGRFEVIREIASGGHGVIFLCRDPTLNRRVALKVPLPEALLTPSMRRRFLAEGRAAAILTHPNIVPVYEAGELGPICYLAEAYIAGLTLAEWQKRHPGCIAPDTAAEIVAQIADGVEHAHDRGILHRDLKPGNVLLDMESAACGSQNASLSNESGQGLSFIPKITDFGIAKSLVADGDETATGTILGTPAYMPPEQAMGRSELVGRASDVYSLGAILYELLTGQPAFHGTTFVDTVRLVTTTDATRPRKLRRDIPRDLEAICLKCLEKEPAKRYPSAFELAADLRRFLADKPTLARPMKPRERIVRWCRRKPALAGLFAVSSLALIVLVANITWSKYRLEELLVEANQQRVRAETNEQLAVYREEIAREHIYASDMATAQDAWHRGSLESAAEILAQHVPKRGQRDLRTIEWTYLSNLVNNPSQLLAGHQGRLGALCYSADGGRLASGAQNGNIRIWETKTGRQVQSWNVPGNKEVNAVAFSPDGKTLAAATDDDRVSIWDTGTATEIGVLEGHAGWIADICFSPDGTRLVSAGSDRTVRLWDVDSRTQIAKLEGHRNIVRGARFLQNGTVIASISEDQTVRIWHAGNHQTLVEAPLNPPMGRSGARPTSIAVSADGAMLAVCLEGTFVRVWYVDPGGTLKQIAEIDDQEARCVCFGRGERSLIVGTNNAKIVEWDITSQVVLRVLRGHRQQILGIAASPTGEEIATGSRNGDLRIWHAQSGQAYRRMAEVPWVASNIAVSIDGTRLIVGGVSPKFAVFDSQSGAELRRDELPQNEQAVFVGEWIVSTLDQNQLRIRDALTGRLLYKIPHELGLVRRAAPLWDRSGLLVAHERGLCLIDLKTLRPRAHLQYPSTVRSIASNRDGGLIALGMHDGELILCDAHNLNVMKKLKAHMDGISGLAFAPSEPLLCTASEDYSARLWNWRSGEQLRILTNLDERFGTLLFSNDSRTVIGRSASNNISTWNVRTGRKTLEIELPGSMTDLAGSADGTRCYLLDHTAHETSEIHVIDFAQVAR